LVLKEGHDISSYGYNSRIWPDAVILEVYEGTDPRRGMVKINYMGQISPITDNQGNPSPINEKYNKDAWLILPCGFKPTTEKSQSSPSNISHPMNQSYGMVTPPRRGDRVIALHAGPQKWYVMGAVGATGGNEPVISEQDEQSIIHRSGASIRLNDHYPGVTGGTGNFDGITGNMSIIANRNIMLAGNKWLPHGLLAAHDSTGINIDLNDEDDSGYSYASLFDNADPGSTAYYEPWDSITTPPLDSKKFLKPPDSIPENTFYLLHQGGGVIKIEDLDTDYSGIKIAAGGMTIAIGEGFWDAGLQNVDDHTSHHADAPNSAAVKDTLKFIHPTGAYFEIDANGKITITTADGQDFVLSSTGSGDFVIEAPGGGKVLLGGASASHNVISDNDKTNSKILLDKIFQLPVTDAGIDPTGFIGHRHGLVTYQSEVQVIS